MHALDLLYTKKYYNIIQCICIRLCLSESLIVNISLINIIEIQVKLKISEIKNLPFFSYHNSYNNTSTYFNSSTVQMCSAMTLAHS